MFAAMRDVMRATQRMESALVQVSIMRMMRALLGLAILLIAPSPLHADATPPAPAPGSALAPRRMDGPFATLDAVCAALRGDDKRFACSTQPMAQLGHAPPPYRQVVVLRARSLSDDPDNPYAVDDDPATYDLHLAVRLDGGWFVAREIATLDDLWNHGSASKHLGVILEARTVPSQPAPLLIVRARSKQELKWTSATLERLVIAGLGPSGRPGSLGPLLLSERGYDDHEEARFDRALSWHLDGDTLVIARSHGGKSWIHVEPEELTKALGRHALTFP
jgi:hypothetical protein